jgi:hypothetical protein
MVTKKRFIYFACVHVFALLIIAFITTVDSYEKSTSFVKNSYTKTLTNVKISFSKSVSIPIVTQYLALSGIEAGYGFFAPNVASAYILKTQVINKNTGRVEKEFFFPPFRTREGRNKYHTFLGSFQDRLTILENKHKKKVSNVYRESKEYGEYLDIYIKSIGRFYYKDYDPNVFMAHCTLYLYHHPSLEESISGRNNPVLIKLIELDANKLIK